MRGRVYEYFLKEFLVNAIKEEGEYYNVVRDCSTYCNNDRTVEWKRCMTSITVPAVYSFRGVELIKENCRDIICINFINVYGQTKEPATLSPCRDELRSVRYQI